MDIASGRLTCKLGVLWFHLSLVIIGSFVLRDPNTKSENLGKNMKYLPFENITYRSNLDSEEIIKRVEEIIEPKRTFRITWTFGGGNHKPYEGEIRGTSFHMNRITEYRNSFLPQCRVKLQISGKLPLFFSCTTYKI